MLQSKLGFRPICLRNFRISEMFLKKLLTMDLHFMKWVKCSIDCKIMKNLIKIQKQKIKYLINCNASIKLIFKCDRDYVEVKYITIRKYRW